MNKSIQYVCFRDYYPIAEDPVLTSRDTLIRNSLLPPPALAAEQPPGSVAFTLPTHCMGRLFDPAKEPRVARVLRWATNGIDDSLVRLLIDRRLQEFGELDWHYPHVFASVGFMRNIRERKRA